jgi:starch-binding outer membrane protein, SusD/RagB family
MQDIAQNLVLVDGLRSDQMDVTENADRDMIDINRHEYRADNSYLDPAAFYKLIININEVIPNLENIVGRDRDFDSTYLEQYTGLLVTLRAWAYFTLARINGEVGLVEGNLAEINPSQPPTYLTKRALINYLIDELLPYYDEDDLFRYDIDLYVLLGELYLEKGNYVKAVEFLKYAIDGPALSNRYIVNNQYGQEGWKEIFINSISQGTTVRTAVPYSFVDGQPNMLEKWMHYDYDYMVKPVESLIDQFENEVQQNDDPGDPYRGLGISYDKAQTGEAWINKYSLDMGIPYSADVIIYRAADIHLLLAEALNRLGHQSYALALLNNGFSAMAADRPPEYFKWGQNKGVRGRVYLKEKTIPGGVENSIEYLEDLIIEERAKELAFEGKRWFDLVRIAERRNDPAYLANKVAAKFEDPEEANYVRNKLMNPDNWYVPIPKVE